MKLCESLQCTNCIGRLGFGYEGVLWIRFDCVYCSILFCLLVSLFVCLSVCLSVCLIVCLLVWLSVCVFPRLILDWILCMIIICTCTAMTLQMRCWNPMPLMLLMSEARSGGTASFIFSSTSALMPRWRHFRRITPMCDFCIGRVRALDLKENQMATLLSNLIKASTKKYSMGTHLRLFFVWFTLSAHVQGS
jgi:hypothetical protein